MQASLSDLYRYQQKLSEVTDRKMHLSTWKNWRDYFLYWLFTAALVFVGLRYAGVPTPFELPFMAGLISAASAFYRDGQYRRVPPSMAATPSRYAQETSVLLEGGIEQLRTAQRVLLSVEQAAQSLRSSVSEAQAIMQPPESSSAMQSMGKGFD